MNHDAPISVNGSRKRILAVASGGGHWVQLLRLRPAFDGHQVVYICTNPEYRLEVPESRFHVVIDANQWSKIRLLFQAVQVLWVMLRERPHVVISTGAAVGYFALRFGKFFGARTIWLDSIANAERLSLSGQLVEKYADLWLTQWELLERPGGPRYAGRVM